MVVIPALAERGILPLREDLLENMRRLNRAEREQLFRFYSTRASTGGNVDRRDRDDNVICNEPDSIQGAYGSGDCGYFYYIFAQKEDKKGYYDDETGS